MKKKFEIKIRNLINKLRKIIIKPNDKLFEVIKTHKNNIYI